MWKFSSIFGFWLYLHICIADSVKHELTKLMSELRSCVVEVMIRGYHEYQKHLAGWSWRNLTCIREPGNVRDPYVPRSRCRSKMCHETAFTCTWRYWCKQHGLAMSRVVVSLISRYEISRIHPDPRKQRKLIPSKISRYTVYKFSCISRLRVA